MLGMLPPECKSDWKGSIGALVHANNCTQNSTTGFSPYFLMYRRQPQLPINVTLRLTPRLMTAPTSTKYVQKLREALGGPIEKPTSFSIRRHGAINTIMINRTR